MGKQFDKIKKVLAILLAVFFVSSLTAASASAADGFGNWGWGNSFGFDGFKKSCDWGCKKDCDWGCKKNCDWGCKKNCDWGCKKNCGWGCGCGCGCKKGTSCNDVLIKALETGPFGCGGIGSIGWI